jgi:hypothetical protein
MTQVLPKDNSLLNKTIQFYNNVDTGIDSILEKTDTVMDKVASLSNNLFIFLKKSIQIKNLKQIFFIIFMSFAMSLLLFGLNIIFGKIII